ncbi:TetR/AcrR family transcriptional regulator [Marinobacter flavimaris]|uniref:TetR/AcrR family transcriptional regulator n=1 Tax=Marinobacter flavimaris TaxID=262076 RepID=A0A3D8H381_9GAMM|nr:TetR family transcriptional regulator [Marinobacter flavimaris]PPI80704.1 TetR/AcrR family transcriptional regulator [Marinobacter flavimaris]RDU41157.1 TetR/AcrR family transcriptional regulator [Marinobacter flavimaris]
MVLKHRLCSGKQRARTESEKALREQQILDAAESLFLTHRFHGLTLADVARETGLTKAALYRYFRSKELLFIAVYRRAMSDWVADVEAIGPDGLPEQFVDRILAHPVFCGLTAILHIALETGLSEEEAREFKLFLLTQTRRLTAVFAAATGQDEAACFRYLMQCQQALIGCWHMSHPPEPARKAMQVEPLTVFQVEFSDTLGNHLSVLTEAFIRQ